MEKVLCSPNTTSLKTLILRKELPLFVRNAWKIRGVSFKKNPTYGRRETTQQIFRFPTKFPVFINVAKPILRCF
jgi:hypothetical protein